MASSAGVNRVTQALLVLNPTATAVATPLTGFGTIGGNDSGAVLLEASGFTKFTFQLVGGTGYTVSVYGTTDRNVYRAWTNNFNPGQPTFPNAPAFNSVALAASWFLLGAPADNTGTGAPANPMTGTNPWTQFSGALTAVRVVLTEVAAPAGNCAVTAEATP